MPAPVPGKLLPHRRAVVIAIAGPVTAGLLLTGCEKPSPSVTAFSGQHSVRVEAGCWNEEEQATDCDVPAASTRSATGTERIDVRPGGTVGISVDREIAENGWVPAIGNRSLVDRPLNDSYYRLTLDAEQIEQGALQIFATVGSNAVRGVWVVGIERG